MLFVSHPLFPLYINLPPPSLLVLLLSFYIYFFLSPIADYFIPKSVPHPTSALAGFFYAFLVSVFAADKILTSADLELGAIDEKGHTAFVCLGLGTSLSGQLVCHFIGLPENFMISFLYIAE